ncbi:hypothetical protein BJ165DRAFT_1487082 [Panaeolus papilionaceus]|nr:hypothetical protein BJ165DRAFT_1487082 [Panaeolus papilionaceus]
MEELVLVEEWLSTATCSFPNWNKSVSLKCCFSFVQEPDPPPRVWASMPSSTPH